MGADNKSNLKKCGEILINLKKKNKKSKTYTFHCSFCETSWDQMKKFSMHLEELHLEHFEEESNELPMIYEPEIKIETPIESKIPEIEDKTLLTEIVKEDPLETEAANISGTSDDNEYSGVQVKDEEEGDDNDTNIKTEDIFDNDSDDNDEDYKPFKDDDSSSSGEERVEESNDNDSESKEEPKKLRKRRKIKLKLKRHKSNRILPELAEDSEEKDLNIALLQAFEKKPYLWDLKEKSKDEAKCQNGYEEIANEINEQLSTNITWEFAKNRINNMRFEYSYQIEKQHNGEDFKLPWYIEHIKYLQQNIQSLTKDRIKKKRFKNIKESHLPIIIELYKKYEDLWQVNSVFFGITTRRDEIFTKIQEELKLNWNIDLTFERLRNHIQYINRLYSKDKEQQLKCQLEKSEFTANSKYYNDLSFLSDCQGPFMCPHCNEIIKKYENYHIHVSEHTNTRPFKCPLCELAFKKFDTCVSHVKRHLSENSFRCDLCGKGYPKKSELDRHLIYHTGEKPFLCQICGAGFRTSRDHDNHIRRHENRFRYECHICKMGFNHLHTLNDHVKSHLNVRDILCNICGKGFTATRYLNNHKLIHEDKKHYKCHFCGKEFAQGAGLRAHRKLHKGYIPAPAVAVQAKRVKKESILE
ncbi:zinc finger protein 679-like [Lucilia cuprina]|uniref:zinc finger protein 679-like n=1 Tax=Lucilia cuprina TaxID=7375 RepID=UPI001F06F252|nr:zinc finger protein 679-like [Lucilia cuprina]